MVRGGGEVLASRIIYTPHDPKGSADSYVVRPLGAKAGIPDLGFGVASVHFIISFRWAGK